MLFEYLLTCERLAELQLAIRSQFLGCAGLCNLELGGINAGQLCRGRNRLDAVRSLP